MQKLYQKNKYDCFQTALACITDEDVGRMPHYGKGMLMMQLYEPDWEEWQMRHGWSLQLLIPPLDLVYEPGEYYVGIYRLTFCSSSHAVVCKDGKMVHEVKFGGNSKYLRDDPWGIVNVKKYDKKEYA